MRSSTLVWIVVIVLVILGAWYWVSQSGASAPTGEQGATAQTNTGLKPITATVSVAHDATLGDYLVAPNGMTLYRYTKDTPGVSNCSGTCVANWPPYEPATAQPPVSPPDATGTLAAITRKDTHTGQVTYNGMPLYFWKSDAKPGDTTGQGVGGVWFVVKP